MSNTPSQPASDPDGQFERAVFSRTPEQHASVRRLAFPIALAGALLGGLAVIWPLVTTVAPLSPPNILAVQVGFAAILMGIGIVFYARGTPGTRRAIIAGVVAIVSGVGSTLVYSLHTIRWQKAMQSTDIANVEAIAKAAGKYAAEHGNEYPRDLLTLLEKGYLNPSALLSPFGGRGTESFYKNKVSLTDLSKVAACSDYTYVGETLHGPYSPQAAPSIIVVYETDPVQRVRCATGFVDGHAAFLTQEEFSKASAISTDILRDIAARPAASATAPASQK